MTIVNPMSRRAEKGAETLVWLATSPQAADVSGAYFFDMKAKTPSVAAQDGEAARKLWEVSGEQCGGSAPGIGGS